jgi:predicted nucleotidyltransferase component of viral defense system
MIPLAAITEWSNVSPWTNTHFVEQDLLICRVLTDLFNDKTLAEKLAFRGGTALHKLYLHPQQRYSEDIDFVQTNPEPIGFVLNRIREVLSYIGAPTIKQKQKNNTVVFRFNTEALPQAVMRLKIEINCQEHLSVLGLQKIPFEVNNSWFTGNCDIVTYTFEELIATKIRALYQRKKGRDLFDIHQALNSGKLDIEKTIFCYKKYMEQSGVQIPSAKQYLNNLQSKISDQIFCSDMEPLLRPGAGYNIHVAYEAFHKNFIPAM